MLIAWLGILGPGWIVLQNIPHVLNFGAASAWEKIGAGAAVAWFFFVGFAAYSLVKRYRRGFEVAETGDGLIVRLPGFNDDAIPWADIGQALVVKVPEGKPKVAAVFLRSKEKNVYIGQLANVFRTAIDVERFVGQVHARSLPSRRDDTESIPPGNWCGD